MSHDAVLPVADLLVTHAGHGTVAAGASFGVPTLCIPMGRAQPMVASRAHELGLAAVCEPDADSATLTERIRGALADASLRRGARTFAATARGHPGVAEAVAACERLLRMGGLPRPVPRDCEIMLDQGRAIEAAGRNASD